MIRGKFARDILTGMIYRRSIRVWSPGWGLLATARGKRLVLRRGQRHQVLGSNYCSWGSSTAISIHSGPVFKFPGTISTHVVVIYRVTLPCVWWHISRLHINLQSNPTGSCPYLRVGRTPGTRKRLFRIWREISSAQKH